MPRKIDPADLDQAVELYLARKPVSEILAATGVSHSVLCRERIRRGIPAWPKRLALDESEVISAYQGGESEYSISLRTGIGRGVIRRRLVEAGIEIRRPSEAGLLRASRMRPDERRIQAAAAHAANVGRKDSLETLIVRAKVRQREGRFGSEGEQLLAHMLELRGLKPVPQQAVSKYNVDMAAAESVAVEVLGGNWHAAKRSHASRTPQILDAGWHLVMVWNQQGTGPITSGAADYIATFCEQVRWQPTLTRQYRVISGGGEMLAARCADDDEFPLIPPSRRAVRRGA